MARPKKSGVDYFSHDTTSGKTIFTLESQYGNDGYAFWFKLLEIIGTQSEHYYDCRNPADWLFLIAKTRVSEVSATEILNTLSQVDAIDKELWEQKVIWIQKFVDRLCEVYRKRGIELPQKPSFCDINNSSTVVSLQESTQSKVKESKDINILSIDEISTFFESVWTLYPKKEGKGQISKTQKNVLFKIGVEKITRAIERYKIAKRNGPKQYLQMGSTFFNSGYVDYLDENYQETEEESPYRRVD